MRKNGWLIYGALACCLAALGCEAADVADSEELATQTDDLDSAERAVITRPVRRRPHWPKDGGTRDAGAQENPCALIDCFPNQRCVVETVQCLVAPCPQVGRCVPIEKPDAGGGLSCANVRCMAGTHCDDGSGRPVCVPDTQPNACADVLCAPNTQCVDGKCVPTGAGTCAATTCPVGSTCYETSLGTECVKTPTCEGHPCTPGSHCELEEVQCIRAPCPPQPTCVEDPIVNPCAAVRCRAGTHCVAKQVQCIRAPCDPVVACVAD